jgi:NADPH-dependent curcumin reductase CurA
VAVPDPGPGQVLVHNRFISVDPYMRGRMRDAESYAPPFALGEVMTGMAVGEVVASQSPDLAVGDIVLHDLGWREYALGDGGAFHRVPPSEAPLSAWLGVLGMVGLTAWVGVLEIAALKPGDVVFVSGAAGAVGSLAGQIARLRGAARVVGSVGSAAKVNATSATSSASMPPSTTTRAPGSSFWRRGAGRHRRLLRQRRRRAPRGGHRRPAPARARGAVRGDLAVQRRRAGARAAQSRLMIGNRLTLRGFLVGDHADRRPAFLAEVGGWLAEGRIRLAETIVDGVENAPAAFIGLMRGENTGKMLVRVGGD